MTAEILLDPSIRDWVLIPLALITLFLGLARHYATAAMATKPEPKLNSAKNAATADYARLLLASTTLAPRDTNSVQSVTPHMSSLERWKPSRWTR